MRVCVFWGGGGGAGFVCLSVSVCVFFLSFLLYFLEGHTTEGTPRLYIITLQDTGYIQKRNGSRKRNRMIIFCILAVARKNITKP